mmetsp:Transcript_23757/g.55360  ORF Transcript_23757/g.55360 Transcript_23757/m.55360 type:complete len:160 (+) Transcript_23757:87-566(+)
MARNLGSWRSVVQASAPLLLLAMARIPAANALLNITCSWDDTDDCPKYDLDFFDMFSPTDKVGCCIPQDGQDYCGTEDECGEWYERAVTLILIILTCIGSILICCLMCCTVACCFPKGFRGGQRGYPYGGPQDGLYSEDTQPLTQGIQEPGTGAYQPVY